MEKSSDCPVQWRRQDNIQRGASKKWKRPVMRHLGVLSKLKSLYSKTFLSLISFDALQAFKHIKTRANHLCHHHPWVQVLYANSKISAFELFNPPRTLPLLPPSQSREKTMVA